MPSFEHEGCHLHYELSGPEGAPAVVLTHGGMLDHRSWLPQIRALSKTYRVLAWDLPGHGRSKPLVMYSNSSAASGLLALMDHVHMTRAVQVALSAGAYVAQEAAMARPERVLGLACFDTTPLTLTKLPWLAERLFRRSAEILRLVPYRLLRRVLPYAFSRRPEVRRYIFEASGQLTKGEFLTFWRGVSAGLHLDPSYLYPFPLLIAHGDRDIVGNIPKLSRAWAAHCSQARLEVIPNASHLSNLDNPEVATRLLLDFIPRCGERP